MASFFGKPPAQAPVPPPRFSPTAPIPPRVAASEDLRRRGDTPSPRRRLDADPCSFVNTLWDLVSDRPEDTPSTWKIL